MLASLPLRAAARVRALSAYQFALGGLFALGVALRFYGLGAAYLTYDEAFTALIVHRPLPDLFAAAAGDVHPPLSYLIYWLFVRLFAGGLAMPCRTPGHRCW